MKAIALVLIAVAVAGAVSIEGAYTLRLDPEQERAVVPPMIYLGLSETLSSFIVGGGFGVRNGAEPGDIPGLTMNLRGSMLVTEDTMVYMRVADIPLVNVHAASHVTVGFVTDL